MLPTFPGWSRHFRPRLTASRTRARARPLPSLDLEVLEVHEGAADPVEDRQPGLRVGRQRRGCPGCDFVRPERAADAVARTRALSGRDQTEVLTEAERCRRQVRLLATLVAEEAGHGVGRGLAQARRRRDRVASAAEREGWAEVEWFWLGRADHRSDRVAGRLMMVMGAVVVLLVVMVVRGEAQRRRSQ